MEDVRQVWQVWHRRTQDSKQLCDLKGAVDACDDAGTNRQSAETMFQTAEDTYKEKYGEDAVTAALSRCRNRPSL